MVDNKFTHIKLQSGKTCIVNEFLGKHLFKALSYSKADTGLLIHHLIHQLCYVDGQQLTIEEIECMSIYDVSELQDCIHLQMEKKPNI